MRNRAQSRVLCSTLAAACAASLLFGVVTPTQAQDNQLFIDPRVPAIDYFSEPTDRVADLNRRLAAGEIKLEYDAGTGYLRSLLAALQVPVASQIAVFSKTSLQKPLISAANPRLIFFNDDVTVAWMAGGFIEVAALDPHKGAVFYGLPQASAVEPRLTRELGCLRCHVSGQTHSVPGFLANSIPSARDGSIMPWLGNGLTDHRSPVAERWGGWYVTGEIGNPHQGNMIIADQRAEQLPATIPPVFLTLDASLDEKNYLAPYSDVAALLVFDHQMQMMNLLVRMGWEGKLVEEKETDEAAALLRQTAVKLVDYMLFVDEADLQPVRGGSGFTEEFNTRGPFDSRGRSLRTLNLQDRLMQYPCSYMIYSDAFAVLPGLAKKAVYERLAEVLAGADQSARYAKLTPSRRREIIEILRETLADLPANFGEPFFR